MYRYITLWYVLLNIVYRWPTNGIFFYTSNATDMISYKVL